LFELAGHPNCAKVTDTPWAISVPESNGICAQMTDEESMEKQPISPDVIARISAGLSFEYAFTGATKIPSKLTATQLKGRTLDTEIAEGAPEKRPATFSKPGNINKPGLAYGTAIHAVMQYIRLDACTDLDSIRREVATMAEEQLISAEQAELVDCEKLLAFFTSPIGKKLRNSKEVLREFKFSLLDAADRYYPDTAGEQVLLQGVVDCAIVEEDGITVLDFKTDYVTDETLKTVADRYTAQVKAYAQALERIYEKPVKSALLYLFTINEFVSVI